MKAHTREQLERLLGFEKPQLLAIINAASAGKKWQFGAGGNAALAKQIEVRIRDIETLMDAGWNALAYHASQEKEDTIAIRVYRRITANLLDDMEPEVMATVMDWAETVEWENKWTRKNERDLWGDPDKGSP